ncbi:hypothetical protein LJ739_07675 [Aestuariibacter halophilus]|uniref:Zinc finger Ogr/Delta-type domain-containing protein n=1 Tax=Fluctibacter halophilus TaxID=226011 RepID=A0ABS8G6J4_9ALTE|nr:hypothetical protein [Aestuariibacter halophilus]MCC2616114.1 hypothetical protein [Aestuariibacter halophilus]
MNIQTQIPCPDCGTPIPVDGAMLLTGTRFSCPNPQCHCAIALNSNDRQVVANAFEQFSYLRERAQHMASGH